MKKIVLIVLLTVYLTVPGWSLTEKDIISKYAPDTVILNKNSISNELYYILELKKDDESIITFTNKSKKKILKWLEILINRLEIKDYYF